MNKPTKMADVRPAGISAEEWEARVNLAAVYRLTAHYGWDDVIYNHSSMRVPGEPRMFLMKKPRKNTHARTNFKNHFGQSVNAFGYFSGNVCII